MRRIQAHSRSNRPVIEVGANREVLGRFQFGGEEPLGPIDPTLWEVTLPAPPLSAVVVISPQGNKELPRPVLVLGIHIFGGLRLHVAHEIGDAVGGGGLEQPVALGMSETEIVDNDLVADGLTEQQAEAELEVLIVEQDELAFIAALDDVVEAGVTEVAARSRHGVFTASEGPHRKGVQSRSGTVRPKRDAFLRECSQKVPGTIWLDGLW